MIDNIHRPLLHLGEFCEPLTMLHQYVCTDQSDFAAIRNASPELMPPAVNGIVQAGIHFCYIKSLERELWSRRATAGSLLG